MPQGSNVRGNVRSLENNNFGGLEGPPVFFSLCVDVPMGAIFFDPENGGTPALSGRRTHGYVGALGNKRAFDPPLYICKSTRAQ
jgi:hypothetical protein